ncbi:hypothetical protein [Streptomyces armeniacus]|uniref:hypothetical protein n=1 Tax=Streptomyces armeniacus TaxID=83291 RepID=UPI001AD829C7|nr:hypothetical protein [Streptomyces armeniacus]
MSIALSVLGTLILAIIVLGTPATLCFVAHARTDSDHGPDCWWCHPHRPRWRKRR